MNTFCAVFYSLWFPGGYQLVTYEFLWEDRTFIVNLNSCIKLGFTGIYNEIHCVLCFCLLLNEVRAHIIHAYRKFYNTFYCHFNVVTLLLILHGYCSQDKIYCDHFDVSSTARTMSRSINCYNPANFRSPMSDMCTDNSFDCTRIK